MKAIITVGISGSGKSTWASEFISGRPSWAVLERDQIRRSLLTPFSWARWDWRREDEVTRLWNRRVREYAKEGVNLVIADTNLTNRGRIIGTLLDLGYDVTVKVFNTPVEVCIERDGRRPEGVRVGEAVIRRQHDRFRKEFWPR